LCINLVLILVLGQDFVHLYANSCILVPGLVGHGLGCFVVKQGGVLTLRDSLGFHYSKF